MFLGKRDYKWEKRSEAFKKSLVSDDLFVFDFLQLSAIMACGMFPYFWETAKKFKSTAVNRVNADWAAVKKRTSSMPKEEFEALSRFCVCHFLICLDPMMLSTLSPIGKANLEKAIFAATRATDAEISAYGANGTMFLSDFNKYSILQAQACLSAIGLGEDAGNDALVSLFEHIRDEMFESLFTALSKVHKAGFSDEQLKAMEEARKIASEENLES